MRAQVEVLQKRNKELMRELRAIRKRNEAMTGFSIIKNS